MKISLEVFALRLIVVNSVQVFSIKTTVFIYYSTKISKLIYDFIILASEDNYIRIWNLYTH